MLSAGGGNLAPHGGVLCEWSGRPSHAQIQSRLATNKAGENPFFSLLSCTIQYLVALLVVVENTYSGGHEETSLERDSMAADKVLLDCTVIYL